MTDDTIARVRLREYPETSKDIFFNAASWGLVPRGAAEAAADLTLRRNRPHGFDEEELGGIQRRCRDAVARLLEVDADEIALAPNTSFGVNLAAALAARGPTGRVLVSAGEFPANVLPWKALEPRGFTVEIVPTGSDGLPDEGELLDRLDGVDVRVLAVSAVQFSTGYFADLETLGAACKERGILFCVDAIQALGVAPVAARRIHADVLASGGQKWLCAPWGSGFAYVRRELQERFDPPMVSWLALEDATRFDDMAHYDLDWLSSARKFELATLGLQDYLGLARAVEIFLEMGVDAVRHHVHTVHEPLLRWIDAHPDVRLVTPRDAARRAGIVSFAPPSVDRAVGALRDRGVVFAVREGAIRLAPHFYNTRAEMEEVVTTLERAV